MAGQKILVHDTSGGFTEVITTQTGGAPSADKVPSLNASGVFDVTMMPSGIGPETAVMPASGALAAGDWVNIFNDAGTVKARKADASSLSTQAMGFVLSAFADAADATVYLEGTNSGVTGMTGGKVFLSETAGAGTATPPTTSGAIVQAIGVAVSSTAVTFDPQTPVLLA